MILCASSSAFRYHLYCIYVILRAAIPWHRPPGQVWRSNLQISEGIASPIRARNDMLIFSNVRKIILYTAGPLVSSRFCTSAQSLLWLCQVSQSLTLRARGGSSAGRQQGYSA